MQISLQLYLFLYILQGCISVAFWSRWLWFWIWSNVKSLTLSFSLRSCRATWTRNTKTNSAGYLWRYKNLFRTAARPSLAKTAPTRTSFPPPRLRSWTWRRRSQRTKRTKGRRSECTTLHCRDMTCWLCFTLGHLLVDMLMRTDRLDCHNSEPNFNKPKDGINPEPAVVSRGPLYVECSHVHKSVHSVYLYVDCILLSFTVRPQDVLHGINLQKRIYLNYCTEKVVGVFFLILLL